MNKATNAPDIPHAAMPEKRDKVHFMPNDEHAAGAETRRSTLTSIPDTPVRAHLRFVVFFFVCFVLCCFAIGSDVVVWSCVGALVCE